MRRKTIISAFLTAVMLLSALPFGTLSQVNSFNLFEVSAFADENSSEPTNENSVVLDGGCSIGFPIAGEIPDMYPKASPEAPYTVELVGWYETDSPATIIGDYDKFEANKRYTVKIHFIPKEGYVFNHPSFIINSQPARYVRDDIYEADFMALSRTNAVYFYVDPPVPDNPPSSSADVYCAENDDLYTASVQWFDVETNSMLSWSDFFVTGHNYMAKIKYEPKYFYDYNPEIVKNAKWYVNNLPVQSPSEEARVVTEYFQAKIVYINMAQVSIDVPIVGSAPDMTPDNTYDYEYTAEVEKWFIPDEPEKIIDENYVFEANKEYTVQIRLTPKPGYAFPKDKISSARILINGKTAEYCGDCIWQITLTAMEHFNEIHFNVDQPVAGDIVSEKVEIIPALASKLFDVSINWYDVQEKRNVNVSEYYSDNKTYDLIISFSPAKGYSTFDTKLLEGTQWYINSELQAEPEKYYLEYRLRKTFVTSEAEAIDVADCRINIPDAGESCIKEAVSCEPEKYDVSILSWTDDQNGGKSMTSLSKYELKKTYTVNVKFTPKSGYKFGSKTKFKINGEPSDGGGYTASTGESSVWKAYYVSRTLVDTAEFTITAPKAEKIVSFDADYDSERYKAELTWYHGDEKLGSGDIFTEGEEYTAKLMLTPEEGFQFGNESVVTINGQTPERTVDSSTGKSVYSIKLVAEKNDTITVTVMMGDVDGGDNITSADALLILRRSVGLENFTKTQDYISDVDGDGKITSADSLAVLRYSVKLPSDGKVGEKVTV